LHEINKQMKKKEAAAAAAKAKASFQCLEKSHS
jgi:hypothetical protein